MQRKEEPTPPTLITNDAITPTFPSTSPQTSSSLTQLAAELRASTEKLQHLNSALELFNKVSREAIQNSAKHNEQ